MAAPRPAPDSILGRNSWKNAFLIVRLAGRCAPYLFRWGFGGRLMIQRNGNRNRRPMSWFRSELPFATQRPHALLHAGEAVAMSIGRFGQPLTVVAHPE